MQCREYLHCVSQLASIAGKAVADADGGQWRCRRGCRRFLRRSEVAEARGEERGAVQSVQEEVVRPAGAVPAELLQRHGESAAGA